jgi:hypothetical protein
MEIVFGSILGLKARETSPDEADERRKTKRVDWISSLSSDEV